MTLVDLGGYLKEVGLGYRGTGNRMKGNEVLDDDQNYKMPIKTKMQIIVKVILTDVDMKFKMKLLKDILMKFDMTSKIELG